MLKQPGYRLIAQTLPSLGQSAFGQKHFIGKAFGTNIQSTSDLNYRLASEKRHADDQPKHHIRGKRRRRIVALSASAAAAFTHS